MSRVNLSETTTVPFFTVIAAAFAGTISFGGGLMWVAAISTRAETAHAKIEEIKQNGSDYSSSLKSLNESVNQLKASTGRIEGKLEVILKEKR